MSTRRAAQPISRRPVVIWLAVVAVLGRLSGQLSAETWREAPHVADAKLAPMLRFAERFLASPLGATPGLRHAASVLDGWDPAGLPGETLVHGDIHPGNLHVSSGGVRLLDWGFACHAPRWFDAAALVLRLVIAGHTPPDAEGVVAELAGWRTPPDRDVTAYVALMTAFSAWAAARGPERHRPKRAAAATAGEAWLAHRG